MFRAGASPRPLQRPENWLERQPQQWIAPKLLILDELGYLSMSRDEANLFFRLVARRYERASLIIIISNKSFIDWGEVFGDQVLATAILDRPLRHSSTINIKGESFRLKEKRRAGMLGNTVQIEPGGTLRQGSHPLTDAATVYARPQRGNHAPPLTAKKRAALQPAPDDQTVKKGTSCFEEKVTN